MTNTDLVKRLLDEDVLPYLSPEQVIDLCSEAAAAIIGLGSANKALTALIAAAPDIARAYLEQCEIVARLTEERDRLRGCLEAIEEEGVSELNAAVLLRRTISGLRSALRSRVMIVTEHAGMSKTTECVLCQRISHTDAENHAPDCLAALKEG